MNLGDFPVFVPCVVPEEAIPALEQLNIPYTAWMDQLPLSCKIEQWSLAQGQNRYTVHVRDVPFECLYLPGQEKKLYIMFSGGGKTPRDVPKFLRWKYQNYLRGSVLCIEDPMYRFHPGIRHVLWYYGTNEVSYLELAARIIRKAMELLSIKAENVVHIGSSGGGYAALYLCNMLDHSSAIAISPQLILSQWREGITKRFLKWGIDLSRADSFGRNRLRLTNKTCRFLISLNVSSHMDYDIQFKPFAAAHGIPVRYGLTAHENFLVWIYRASLLGEIHGDMPQKIGLTAMNYILEKANQGEDIGELYPVSLLMGMEFQEKSALREKLRQNALAENIYEAYFPEMVSHILSMELNRVAGGKGDIFFTGQIPAVSFRKYKKNVVNFYINGRTEFYYQMLYYKEGFNFRFLYDLSTLEGEEAAWLASAQRAIQESNTSHADTPIHNRVEKNQFIMTARVIPETLSEVIQMILTASEKLLPCRETEADTPET